jgi:hypothetical protein
LPVSRHIWMLWFMFMYFILTKHFCAKPKGSKYDLSTHV